MGWIKFSERCPTKRDKYFVVELIEAYPEKAFFKGYPAYRKIDLMFWKQKQKIENDYVDRCVYVKYNCFENEYGQEKTKENILYWYELDSIPEEENV